jgi:hypothetical protein
MNWIPKIERKCLVEEYAYVIELLVVMLLEINAVINVTYS